MNVKELIEKLETLDPTAEVQYKTNVMVTDSQGFKKVQSGWSSLEQKNVFTTRFGGNTIFIGDN